MGYDVIGDIHGQFDKLEQLLRNMGYSNRDGSWRHVDHTAIFVGDFIDQGPRQVDTVNLVRNMIDAGQAQAVMGNHEFNAIAWYLRNPEFEDEYLRPHHGELGLKNRHQHAAFLAEAEGKALHGELVDWFLSLPLWLDLPELRVVHACWHAPYMAELGLAPGRRLTKEVMTAASREGSMEFRTVEAITKGLEVALPGGFHFHDNHGSRRSRVRIRWWDRDATTFRKAAILSPDLLSQLPDTPIPDSSRVEYDNVKPVLFGHYWFKGKQLPVSPKVACVDYSAGRGGPLAAYRWDGEATLSATSFASSH